MSSSNIEPHLPGAARRGTTPLMAILTLVIPSASAIAMSGCGDSESSPGQSDAATSPGDADPGPTALYSLGSIVETIDGNRTTYIQTLTSLDIAEVTNESAIEVPGNGIHLAYGGHVYIGLDEEPTIIRYTPDADGTLQESGRLSFLNQGLTRVGFGNAFVSASKAYMVSDEQNVAIVWDPEAMEIRTTIDLSAVAKDDFDEEFWTVTHRDGRVYIPVRYSNWTEEVIDQSVTLVIIDAAEDRILATATDSRCHSGGRPVFAPSGDAYILADGRNWSAQLFATLRTGEVPPTCLLRIRAGSLEFDSGYLVEIAALTGGLDAASELETAADGSGLGLAKMFYPDELQPDTSVDREFAFWKQPAFRRWRIELGDEPSAVPVADLPMSTLEWEGVAMDGKLYVGESPDYVRSRVYEIDPQANQTVPLFEMDGTFYGLHRLR